MSMPVLAQLGGGAVALLLGAFPVLAALGLVETEGGIEPFARVFSFVFGAVFIALGGWVMARPFLAIARSHGAVTVRDAFRMALPHLTRRVTRTSVGAALGVGILALGFWLAVAGVSVPLLGGSDGMRAVVGIEFLVIHGFPFLVVAAIFARSTTGRGRVVATGALAALVMLYGAVAWKVAAGPGGLVALLYLMVPNVLAFLGTESPASNRVLVTSRWVIKLALFLLTAAVLGGGSFDGPEAVWVGAVYFTLLAGVELFRVVEIPGELAAE